MSVRLRYKLLFQPLQFPAKVLCGMRKALSYQDEYRKVPYLQEPEPVAFLYPCKVRTVLKILKEAEGNSTV